MDMQGQENPSLGIGEEESGKQMLGSWTTLKCPMMPLDWGLGILETPDQAPQSKSSKCYQLKMYESTSASYAQKYPCLHSGNLPNMSDHKDGTKSQ